MNIDVCNIYKFVEIAKFYQVICIHFVIIVFIKFGKNNIVRLFIFLLQNYIFFEIKILKLQEKRPFS